jgi:hypothetical protein
MRLLAIFGGLAAIVAIVAVLWLMRPSAEKAAGNTAIGNAIADQQAIDAANRDIENEERAAAAGLAGTANDANPAANVQQNAAR